MLWEIYQTLLAEWVTQGSDGLMSGATQAEVLLFLLPYSKKDSYDKTDLKEGATGHLPWDFSRLCERGSLLVPACFIHTCLKASCYFDNVWTEQVLITLNQGQKAGTAEDIISHHSLFLKQVWMKMFFSLSLSEPVPPNWGSCFYTFIIVLSLFLIILTW